MEGRCQATGVRASAHGGSNPDGGTALNPVDLARKRWKPVRKALEHCEELGLELSQVGERLAALRGELSQAKEADREAYAAAIAAGRDEPARQAEQLAIRIEAEQRRFDACVTAVENANAKLDKLRAENRSAWRKEALAKIAEAHSAYEQSIRLLAERREALADEVALHGWIADGIGVSPITDSLSGRIAPGRDGRQPLSFSRVEGELNDDAMSIATHLREIDAPSAWSLMKRAEALVGKDTTREQALKQVDPHGSWDQ
jgi:hypothetical protein